MKTFVLHDESVNTYGFRLLTSGANLDEFKRNPVMLLNHNDWSMPIGRWENIRIEGSKILADPVFDDNDAVGRQVKEKVEKNFIRAASIGSWPPEEVTDDMNLKLPGQQGVTVTRWTVREASIVSIPANHNAIAFYDRATGTQIDMTDRQALVKLFDISKNSNFKKSGMNEIARLLKLAESASESDITAALRLALSDRDRLKAENVTLISRVDELNAAAKAKKAAEAVSLVDAAIKDGRIDAKAKASYMKLFDNDFESARITLEAIPHRRSVSDRLTDQDQINTAEMTYMEKTSWDDLDRNQKLVVLKDKYPDLYKQKFTERFGVEPKKS